MKAIPFPQANKVLKAPPSPRTDIQELIDKLAAGGADMTTEQERLDATFPPDQEVHDLPVWCGLAGGAYRCISCWEPSQEERVGIAAGGPVWLLVVGTTHPPLVLDAVNPFEERHESPPSIMPPDEALTLVGKLLERFNPGQLLSLRVVREAIPLEPGPIFEGAKATCQRHRKGRLFILIQEVEGELPMQTFAAGWTPDLMAKMEPPGRILEGEERQEIIEALGGAIKEEGTGKPEQEGEVSETSVCLLCGQPWPHTHTEEQIREWVGHGGERGPEPVTVERRARAWEMEGWAAGVALYMEALRAAGLPAPSFDFEEKSHPNEAEPEKSDITLRFTLKAGGASIPPSSGEKVDEP